MSVKHKDAVQIDRADPKFRRYVGVKETAAYLAYDMSQSYHIGEIDRFAMSIVGVRDTMYEKILTINGVWDVINDLFMGVLVERTRTRWGKFKPYLMFLAIPGTILSIIYWLLPMILHGEGITAMQKAVVYLLLQIIMEGVGTFQDIARKGIMATITPFPYDRSRLITFANLFSGMLGEKVPGYIFDGLHDAFLNGKLGGPVHLRSLFMIMGVITTLIAGAGAFWFFCICRERIQQSVEGPNLRDSFRTVIRNKPLLMLTLSETLRGLSVGGSKTDYLTDVLKFKSLGTICGIPSVVINPLSYAWIPWFRRHFSDKTLYLLGTNCMDIAAVPVFFVGLIKTSKGRVYQRRWIMAIVLTLYEMVFTVFWGVRSVIPTELYNESMDYCEWKNGYRGEAMISTARSLAAKVSGKISNVARIRVRRFFGYDPNKYGKGIEQTDSVKFMLFAMWTIVPAVTTIASVIPMLLYKVSDEERAQMYADLQARRAAMAAEAEQVV